MIVKTLPISAVSFPLSSSMMNRRPVPEVRARAFCVTPSPLRVCRTNLPMSPGVYFIAFIPSKEVTVREYFSIFEVEVNIMLPYGNTKFAGNPRRPKYSRSGTWRVSHFHQFLARRIGSDSPSGSTKPPPVFLQLDDLTGSPRHADSPVRPRPRRRPSRRC